MPLNQILYLKAIGFQNETIKKSGQKLLFIPLRIEVLPRFLQKCLRSNFTSDLGSLEPLKQPLRAFFQTHCPNLQVLDMSNVRTVAHATAHIPIERLQEGCPKLRVLRITNSQLALAPATISEQVSPSRLFLRRSRRARLMLVLVRRSSHQVSPSWRSWAWRRRSGGRTWRRRNRLSTTTPWAASSRRRSSYVFSTSGGRTESRTRVWFESRRGTLSTYISQVSCSFEDTLSYLKTQQPKVFDENWA